MSHVGQSFVTAQFSYGRHLPTACASNSQSPSRRRSFTG
jgi:hypothetical protein